MSGKRISELDVTVIVRELDRWRDGELGSKLTWEILEDCYGFSRQALQSHIRIKAAYQAAKTALRGGLVQTRQASDQQISVLKMEVSKLVAGLEVYKKREQEWQKRWQRIAYHLRCKGFNVSEIDTEISISSPLPSQSEANKILKLFDQPMVPTGRK